MGGNACPAHSPAGARERLSPATGDVSQLLPALTAGVGIGLASPVAVMRWGGFEPTNLHQAYLACQPSRAGWALPASCGRAASRGKPQERLTLHAHWGLLIASCERGDLMPTPRGISVYDDDGKREVEVPIGRHLSGYAMDELYEAVVHDRSLIRDGRWGKATLEALPRDRGISPATPGGLSRAPVPDRRLSSQGMRGHLPA